MRPSRRRLDRLTLPIETPRLALRLPQARDVPDLRRSLRNPLTARAEGAPLHSAEERRDPAKMVRRTRAEFRREEHLSLSVVLRRDRSTIGRVGLRGFDWTWRTVESLAYWIDPAEWNHGYATEAAWFLCHEALFHLGIRRVGSSALEGNRASIRVLKKLGFVREGRQREAVRFRGRPKDMMMYGLLRSELPPWSTIRHDAGPS